MLRALTAHTFPLLYTVLINYFFWCTAVVTFYRKVHFLQYHVASTQEQIAKPGLEHDIIHALKQT
jgi:hypothetical protein